MGDGRRESPSVSLVSLVADFVTNGFQLKYRDMPRGPGFPNEIYESIDVSPAEHNCRAVSCNRKDYVRAGEVSPMQTQIQYRFLC